MSEEKTTDSKPTDDAGNAERVAPEDLRLRKPEATDIAAILGMLAALVGGFALITGLMWWLVTKVLGLWPKVFLIVGAVCLIYAIVVNAKSILAAFRERRVLTGANAILFAAVVFGILVLLNIVAIRHDTVMLFGHETPLYFRHDATKDKQFSLSSQTVKIIRSLNKDVEMIAFASPDHYEQRMMRDRLSEYSTHSPRLKVEFHDPFTRRDKAQEFNVTMDGTVVVRAGEKTENVMGGEEERLTSAILAVTTGAKTKVYFLAGHGEYDPTALEGSCNAIKNGLESQQYAVEALTLIHEEKPRIPADCAALVIAGAKQSLQDKEMAAITKYADQGGKLFIALANEATAPTFEEVLSPRGVTPLRGRVLEPDRSANAGYPAAPVIMKPESHDVTKELTGYPMVLPMTTAFEVEIGEEPPPSYPGAPPQPPSKKAQELLRSSAQAWLDVLDDAGIGNDEKDGEEQAGPLTMAAAIDESKKDQPPMPPGAPPLPEEDEDAPGTRIVVVGSAEFMTDHTIQGSGIHGNGFFVLNSIAWLLSDEKLISIPPKETEVAYLTMVTAQKAISAVIALLIVPGLVVFAGGIVWWRRRR